MSLANINLKFGVNLKDFSSNLESVQKRVNKVSKSMEKVGQSMSVAVTLPLVAVGALATKINVDFDDSMRKVMATSNATAEEFDALKEKAKEMGAATRFSASQSAEAMNYMALAGWKTQQVIAGLPAVLNLAAASGEDLAMVSDIVTDGLTAFGKSAEYSNKFTDILAAAASNANTTIGMLGEGFQYVAPLAGALGFSVEDTAHALGIMANAGIKASKGGTALRAILSRMVHPIGESKKAMEELGISVTNADGSVKPLNDILVDLRARFASLPAAQKASYAGMLAGQEAMSGLLAIVNTGTADFDKLGTALKESGGTAQRMADQMEGGLGGAMRSLKSATEGLMIQLGEILAPAMMKIASVAKAVVKWFSSLNDTTKTVIVVVGALLAAVGPLLLAIGFMGTTVIPMVTTAMAAMGIAITPLVLKIAAIAAAVGILVLVGKAVVESWDTVKTFFVQMWDKVKILFINGVAATLKTFNKFTSLIGLDFSNTIDKLQEESKGLKEALDAQPVVTLGDVFSEIGSNIVGTFTKVKDKVTSSLSAARTEMNAATVDAAALANALSLAGGGKQKPITSAVGGGESMLPDMPVDAFREKINSIGLAAKSLTPVLSQVAVDISEGFNQIINEGIVTGLSTFGEAIGSLLSGTGNMAGMASALLGTLGSVLGQVGKLAIATGIAVLGIKKALQTLNPIAAIAAGVALIALSQVVKARAANLGGGSVTAGGELGGASGARAMGGTVMANKSYLVGERGPEMFTPSGHGGITANNRMGGESIRIHLTGDLVGKGSELKAVIDREFVINGRTS